MSNGNVGLARRHSAQPCGTLDVTNQAYAAQAQTTKTALTGDLGASRQTRVARLGGIKHSALDRVGSWRGLADSRATKHVRIGGR